jgi:hypothetical protein
MSWKDAPLNSSPAQTEATSPEASGWRAAPKLPPVHPDEQVGAGEHFFNRWANAILGGKPAVDIAGTLMTKAAMALGGGSGKSNVSLTDKAKAELRAMGEDVPDENAAPGFLDMYRDIRDRRNRRVALGDKQQPEAGVLGTIASLPSNYVLGRGLPVAGAPAVIANLGKYGPAAARIAAATGTGAAYGTAFALTNGNADLTRGEFGKAADDIAGTENWKSAVANYTKGNKGRAFLDMLGAGAPGGAIGGVLFGGAAEAAKRPGIINKTEEFANARAVKATEPDLAHYRMMERDGRIQELGKDLREKGVVTYGSSLKNIADRSAGIMKTQGSDIGKFLDDVDGRSYVDQRDYPIMAAKHGTITEPVTTQRHVGWDMTPENQTQHVGHTSFDESVITPKAITENVTENVTRPAVLGYEPQVASERWIRQGFDADAAARNIEKQLMPQYEHKMGKSELTSVIQREIENLRAENPRTFSAANQTKSGLSDAISWTNQTEAGKNALLKQIRGALNGEMEHQAEAMLRATNAPENSMKAYLENKRLYGNMATAADSAEDALVRRARNRFLSPSDHGVGATAAMVVDPVTGIAMAGANKVAREFGSSFTASAAGDVAKALRSEALPSGVARYAPALEQPFALGARPMSFADLMDDDQAREQQARAAALRKRR